MLSEITTLSLYVVHYQRYRVETFFMNFRDTILLSAVLFTSSHTSVFWFCISLGAASRLLLSTSFFISSDSARLLCLLLLLLLLFAHSVLVIVSYYIYEYFVRE